eukprot:123901_1
MAQEEKKSDNASGFVRVDPPEEIVLPTDQMQKDTVIFWIERSKNKNVVVYEANKQSDHYNEVLGYWLDIDPEYVKANRKKGIMTDRAELTFIEKKMAYGYNLVTDEQSKKTKTYKLSIVSVPEMEINLITDKDGKPHAITIINGKQCYLRKIYVATQESWYGMPKVLHVIIVGIEVETGDIQSAKKTV